MKDETAQEFLQQIKATNAILSIIAEELQKISQAAAPAAPNYRRPFAEYPGFDWASIEAEVLNQDDKGATLVQYAGYTWTRRYGDGKFGKAIWFSRANGTDEAGNIRYARLITFKDFAQAEPIPFPNAKASGPNPSPPMPQAQAVAHAHGDDESSRSDFYGLVSQVMASGQAEAQKVNEVIRAVNQQGWGWGISQLQAISA